MAKKGKKARERARRQAALRARNAMGPDDPEAQETGDEEPQGSGQPATKRAERVARREAARQARIEATRQKLKRKRRKQVLIAGVSALVVLLAGGFGFWRWREGRAGLQDALAASGCGSIETFDDVGWAHIDSADFPGPTPYNTDPPTSGDHFGGRIAPWGFYDEPVAGGIDEPGTYVHNLEHGGSVIHYDPSSLSDQDIEALEEVIEEFPNGAMAIPNRTIDEPLVMTAAQAMQKCESVDKRVVQNFIKVRCNQTHEPISEC